MSKGLQALDNIVLSKRDTNNVPVKSYVSDLYRNDIEIIEKELKCFEIIKNKPQRELELIQLGTIATYEDYLKHISNWCREYLDFRYEREEFDMLKELLKGE